MSDATGRAGAAKTAAHAAQQEALVTMEQWDVPSQEPPGRGVIPWLVRKVVELAQDPHPSVAATESGWKVYTGEGRGRAAGSEWLANIDVSSLLRSAKAQAAIRATLDVDKDLSVSDDERPAAIMARYEELLATEGRPGSDQDGLEAGQGEGLAPT